MAIRNDSPIPARQGSLSRAVLLRAGGGAAAAGALAAADTGSLTAAARAIASSAVIGRARQTVNFVHWGSGAKLTQLYGRFVQQFEAQHPTITINMIPVAAQSWADFASVMVTRIAGGDTPDIMRVDLAGLQVLGRKGLLLPLDAFMHRDAAYVDAFRADSPTVFWRLLSYKGAQLALPFTWSTPVLMYNTRLVATPPAAWTADDFLALGARLKAKGLYAIGNVVIDGSMLFSLESWAAAAGSSLLSADWTRSAARDRGNLVAWQFLYDLVQTHKYAPRPSPQFDDEGYLQAGRIGTAFDNGRGYAKDYALQRICSATACVADVAPLPVLGGGPRRALVSCDGFPITRVSKHPEAAWAWAMFLSSPQVLGAYTQQGAYLPCRSSLAASARVMAPPVHYHRYLDNLRAGGIPLPAPPSYLEVDTAATRWFSKMIAGEATPAAALAGLDRDLTAILARPV